MDRKPHSILIVDDDFLLVEYLKDIVQDIGYEVCGSAATAEEAVSMARKHHPQAILMDVRLLGRRDGVDAALEIRAKQKTSIIFITGSNEPDTIARIKTGGPCAILIKPILPEQLHETLRSLPH
jgi:two-component system, response regulator PdtaR